MKHRKKNIKPAKRNNIIEKMTPISLWSRALRRSRWKYFHSYKGQVEYKNDNGRQRRKFAAMDAYPS